MIGLKLSTNHADLRVTERVRHFQVLKFLPGRGQLHLHGANEPAPGIRCVFDVLVRGVNLQQDCPLVRRGRVVGDRELAALLEWLSALHESLEDVQAAFAILGTFSNVVDLWVEWRRHLYAVCVSQDSKSKE